MSDDMRERRTRLVVIGLFGLIALMIAWDLVTDYREGADSHHLLIELTILLLATSGVAILLRRFGSTHAQLVYARGEAERWREQNREIIRGLASAIDGQFSRWKLTPAEAQIGLMLLKGYSHKEIASLRSTSERTIREQARAIYRKSDLPGRASLAAFFLEDLLLPQDTETDVIGK